MTRILRALVVCALFALVRSAAADGLIVITQDVVTTPGHPTYAPLAVRKHIVDVTIDDQVATTSVDQVFYNPSNQRLEGTYIFPLPEGGHIDKFTMDINGQQVAAELLPADKARAIYEEIVRKTRDPALMEYAGRGLVKVRIFPIEPNSEKQVKLSYTQLLKNDNGLVSYSYPLNTEKFSSKPIPNVAIKVAIETKQPLRTVYSPSHSVEVKQTGDRKAVVGFEARDVKPDTDFQLFYATAVPKNGDIALNLLSFKSGEGNSAGDTGYFMLLASPGALRDEKRVIGKDVVFVVDTSGSMAGDKLVQARKAMQFCLASLNEKDRFEIVRFSTEAEPLFDGLASVTKETVGKAKAFVEDFKATGGTAIDEALTKAVRYAAGQQGDSKIKVATDRPAVVIFLTDGQPTIGVTDEATIVSRVENAAKIRVFCFGVGNDVNTHLLDKITEKTRAASQYVLPAEDIEVKVSNFYARISSPVMTNLKLSFGDKVRVSKVSPAALPDLFVGDQVVVLGAYTGSGPVAVTLEGTVEGEARKLVNDAAFAEKDATHGFIPRLWATRRVGYLLEEIRLRGENAELRDEATQLARQWGIVTPYTSYLIIEDEGRRNVPMAARTQSQVANDRDANAAASGAFRAMKSEKVGESSVEAARASGEMKSAGGSGWGSAAPLAPAATTGPGGGSGVGGGLKSNFSVIGGLANSKAQATRVVRNRTFYQNGDAWIDGAVQGNTAAKRVQVKFGSDEYFALMKKHPDASAWLSIGKSVTIFLDGTIYEVTEAKE